MPVESASVTGPLATGAAATAVAAASVAADEPEELSDDLEQPVASVAAKRQAMARAYEFFTTGYFLCEWRSSNETVRQLLAAPSAVPSRVGRVRRARRRDFAAALPT
jgi:hypothetical protein